MRALVALAVFAMLAPAASIAQVYAAWSDVDFLIDQRWSNINNRLANERMGYIRKAAGLDSSGKSGRKSSSRGSGSSVANRSLLALGDTASTDLSRLRPYLATTRLSEQQAAQVLAMYNQVADRLGVPYNDSASGIAAFLAGSYAAYTNKPFPDAYYKPLYEQFANTLASDEGQKRTPKAQRVEYYQRLVVVGMLYQLTQLELQKNPRPGEVAKMREAAGRAFTEIAGISPDSIQFTAKGLAPR
ncbi:MAG: hypothetical protein QM599_10410 [Pseudoxanthomonas sp.]